MPTDFPQNASAQLPHKIPLQGANNFRDLGGYRCTDGRRIMTGRVFRSDHLGDLTAEDQQTLSRLGVRTVIDLRRERERAEKLDRLDDPNIEQIWLPIDAQGADVHELRRRLESAGMSAQEARNHLLKANREFVSDFSHVFRQFMALLLAPERYPLVFHCTAGKDRAGLAAALLLIAAGASKETAFNDYLSTNHCTAESLQTIQRQLEHMPALKGSADAVVTLMTVEEAFLEEAFSTIDRLYQSLDIFMDQALNMPPARQTQLRTILCE